MQNILTVLGPLCVGAVRK